MPLENVVPQLTPLWEMLQRHKTPGWQIVLERERDTSLRRSTSKLAIVKSQGAIDLRRWNWPAVAMLFNLRGTMGGAWLS